MHLLLTFPAWRPRGRTQSAAVGAGYVVAFTALWSSDLVGPLLAGAVLAIDGSAYRGAIGVARRDRRTALQAAAVFSLAVTVGAVTRQLVPGRHAVAAMVLVYEASVVWIACFLARRAQPAENPVVADLVVELDEAPGTELRRALGRCPW